MNAKCVSIVTKTDRPNVATKTQNQNVDRPAEPNQRIICRPERQIMKQKLVRAKNTDTIKKL